MSSLAHTRAQEFWEVDAEKRSVQVTTLAGTMTYGVIPVDQISAF